MRRDRAAALVGVVLLCLFSAAALADEVRLANGVVHTDYAATISIELEDIRSLSIVDGDGGVHDIAALDLPSVQPRGLSPRSGRGLQRPRIRLRGLRAR
jgi:hypothetical protein